MSVFTLDTQHEPGASPIERYAPRRRSRCTPRAAARRCTRRCFRSARPTPHSHAHNHPTPRYNQIHFFLLISRQGKVRLAKWYSTFSQKERARVLKETAPLVLARPLKLCNFVDWKAFKLVRRARTLLRFRLLVVLLLHHMLWCCRVVVPYDARAAPRCFACCTMTPRAACAAAAPRRAARCAPPPPSTKSNPIQTSNSNSNSYSKKVYRRYASLYFVVGADPGDNELLCLESIHLFVECLDR